MAQSIPSSIAAPADWTQMVGVAPSGGQTVPSASNDPSSLVEGFKPVAPTAPMYTSSAQPYQQPALNIHKPTMQAMQDTQRVPITNQATSTIQARRQNRFAGIANAVNTVTNEVQKKKFENITTDATNVSRAQGQIANAQQAAQSAIATLKDKNATPEAKKSAQEALTSAQKVITTNQASMDSILKDDKRRKELAKAFNVSFTDPSANEKNKAYIDAGKSGLEEAKKNDTAGLSANTPEEKAIQDYNKTQEGGGYAQQFMNQQPQQLGVNPLYETQQKQFEAQQKYMGQYIMPRVLDGLSRQAVAEIKEQGANSRVEFRAIFTEAENAKKLAAQKDIAQDRNKTALMQTQQRNAALMARTYANIKSREKMASDPKYHVIGTQNILKEQLKAINESDTQVRGLQGQNDKLMQQVAIIDANVKNGNMTAKEGAAAKQNYQDTIASNKRTIGYIQDITNDMRTHLIGTPTGTTGINNGNTGQSTSRPGITDSGPSDDSSDEEGVIDSGSADSGSLDIGSV